MPALFLALREGDLEKVKRLVAEGADVADVDCFGTPLLEAAYYGHIPIMQWLLDEGGSSLTEKDMNSTHALSMAAVSGKFPAMQYLLEE
jgi:ankyrin repeat protein